MSTLSDALAARDRTREAEQWNEDTESLALDWITKALPHLKEWAECIRCSIPEYAGERETILALIAQAEGQKEGENE